MFNVSRFWRFFATAICFFFFGVGGAFFTFLFFPIVNFCVRSEPRRKVIAQKSIRLAFRLFVSIMQFLGAVKIEVEGLDILNRDKGCIIVANHPTLIDYVLITSLLPKCSCIVKADMWNNPFARGAITAGGYISNSDTTDMLSECGKTLQDGNVLLIFPEGTRTIPGQQIQLKRGAAHIAVRTRSDLRIIHIQCKPLFLFKGDKWYKVPQSRPLFNIKVKDKVKIESFLQEAPSEAIAVRRVTKFLSEALAPEDCPQEKV